MSRREELAENLAAIERRVERACRSAGRDRSEITLVVVTKTYPASDVELLAELGITEVGENRHPEAGDKAAGVAVDVHWHFLGALQTNKAGAVARYADVVHSIDRAKLARSLSRGAQAADRVLGALVQVDFDRSDPGRSGAAVPDVLELARLVAELPGLRLDGLMTVAPLGVDPAPVFAELMELSGRLRSEHPHAAVVSAGMSEDFELAVAAGATHLRVGRAILGERPPLG